LAEHRGVHPATLVAPYTLQQAGIVGTQGGKAVVFGVQGGASAPDHADWDVGDLTLEAWFKTAVAGNQRRRIVSHQGALASGWWLGTENQGVEFGLKGQGIYCFGANTLDGAWHHLAWVRVLSVENNLYLDGANVANVLSDTGVVQNFETDALFIARLSTLLGGIDESCQGTLDEVAVYRKALTGVRVKAHYDVGVTP
jgi:hypothetical protein